MSRSRLALVLLACLTLLPIPSAAAGTAIAPAAPSATGAAGAAFAHLKALAGRWRGKSTKGWTESIELRLIAGDSVLLETSRFTDDPAGKNAMATAIQMDGKALLLTHYCEAGNTPRLQATAFEDGGKTLTFTFHDGVNLASRDRGHMDKVVMHLIDDNHFRARWTWYQDAKETWMEEIVYERMR
jgi:hypothetical protein